MFVVWVYDLFYYGLDFCIGKIYVCVFFIFGDCFGGIDDMDYLMGFLCWFSGYFLVWVGNYFFDGDVFCWVLVLVLL